MSVYSRRLIHALTLALGLLAALSPAVMASGLSNARATAMAGAQISLAKGYYSPLFNPANLGLPDYQLRGLQVIGLGASVRNNSFSLDDYNNFTGAQLSDADKQELLSKIPPEGLQVSADGELSAFGFGTGNIAISLSAMGAAEINLSRTAVELLLNGNAIAETLVLDDIYGEGYGLASLNFSYGHLLYKHLDRQFAVGATARLIKGLEYEEIIEANGQAVTLSTGFEGAGSLVARSASGGSGLSVDLGGVLQINRSYTVGAGIYNFLSAVQWTDGTEEHRYSFDFDTVTAVNMGNDSLITTSDTTVEIGSFTTHLPTTVRIGLAKTQGSLLWAVDWEQGFRQAAGSSPTPRISAGAEYHVLRFLPVRAGFGLGGKQGATYAGGIGVEFSAFHIDLGVASYNAIAGPSGNGLNFAVSCGIQF